MIIGRTKTGQSERGRGLKIIVDFSRDPEWHEIFFGEPTVQKLEEFRSFIIGEGRDRCSGCPLMGRRMIPSSSEFLKRASRGDTVVDIGCYGWRLSDACINQGLNLVGVDQAEPPQLLQRSFASKQLGIEEAHQWLSDFSSPSASSESGDMGPEQ